MRRRMLSRGESPFFDGAEVVIREARSVGVSLDEAAACVLLELMQTVENSVVNVSGIHGSAAMRQKHVIDSLACLPVARLRDGECCVDVGSGGGFPGLPLAIASPHVEFTLVESVGRKAAFLRSAVERLGLKNVEVVNERAEWLGRQATWRERADCVVVRAVAAMRVVAEYCLPLCVLGGRWISLQGPSGEGEFGRAESLISALGGRLGEQLELRLPGGDARRVVRVEKVRGTPRRFPRVSARGTRPAGEGP